MAGFHARHLVYAKSNLARGAESSPPTDCVSSLDLCEIRPYSGGRGNPPLRVAFRRWVCAKSDCARAGAEGLACRLGRCFCILPYAEVSTGDPHPAPTGCDSPLDCADFAERHRGRSLRVVHRRWGCVESHRARDFTAIVSHFLHIEKGFYQHLSNIFLLSHFFAKKFVCSPDIGTFLRVLICIFF